MATLIVSDATFEKLTRRAAALGTTVEALAAPPLERLADEPMPEEVIRLPARGNLSAEERTRIFNQILADARARADRYPPGHVTDVSREAMYEGCGE